MEKTQNDIERIRKEELKVLREKMGVHEFIKLLQSYGKGTGDYTKEKYENDEDITIEDFKKYLAENN